MNLWSKLKAAASKAANVLRAVTTGAAEQVMQAVDIVGEADGIQEQRSITIGLITIGKHPGGVSSAKSQRSPELVQQLKEAAMLKRERKAWKRARDAYRCDLFNDTVPHGGYRSLVGAIS